MNILIDIGHPAHVHIFKHFANEMLSRSHSILFTCREKEFEKQLLDKYNLPYKSFGRKYSSVFGKLWGLIKYDLKELIAGYKFKPDIFLSHGSYCAAHASFLLGKPHISLEDTFNFEQIWLYKPFTKVILTSDYDHPLKSGKVIKYSGYHELAYLHPKRYNPDKSVLNELGVEENEKYVILRFVSWRASHDIGHTGISLENKLYAIESFNKFAKVFVSSESELPDEIKEYQINILPHKIHDAIAFASLLFGESSTMAEEAAMLGTPSIYLYNESTYYTKHLEEEYHLMYNYSESIEDQLKAINKGTELLNISDLKQEWLLRREKMLSEKIDVTAFLVWFVENWPESFRVMRDNPEYQKRFRDFKE
jgi:uncharacterized protein